MPKQARRSFKGHLPKFIENKGTMALYKCSICDERVIARNEEDARAILDYTECEKG